MARVAPVALWIGLLWVLGTPLSAAAADESVAFDPDLPTETVEESEFVAGIRQAVKRRAQILDRGGLTRVTAPPAAGVAPWWEAQVTTPQLGDSYYQAPLLDFVDRSVAHSSQIAVFSSIPLIRETGIDEVDGIYVPRLFAEGKYEHRNEPVGSVLTTGRPGRFRQNEGALELGVRKRFITGGEASLYQRFTEVRNNSDFLFPNPQAGSNTGFSLVQPLLRGGGIGYYKALRDLAVLDTAVSRHEFLRQVESHLLEVHRSYWALYLARALYLQKERMAEDTEQILDKLEARAELDAQQSQVLRAKSAQVDRQTDLLRAKIAVENSSSRIRALVNDPALEPYTELVPTELPRASYPEVRLATVIEKAAEERPEVRQGYLAYEAATLRVGRAKRDTWALLDLVIEGSFNGNDGQRYAFDQAFRDGFDNTPGVLVGLRFEIPLGRDESKARLSRRRLELVQAGDQLRNTMDTVILESQVAVAEYATAVAELEGRRSVWDATRQDFEQKRERWEQGIGGESGAARLEFLLDAQDRLLDSEARLVHAQVNYLVAASTIERVQGTLLESQGITVAEVREEDELPTLDLGRD